MNLQQFSKLTPTVIPLSHHNPFCESSYLPRYSQCSTFRTVLSLGTPVRKCYKSCPDPIQCLDEQTQVSTKRICIHPVLQMGS